MSFRKFQCKYLPRDMSDHRVVEERGDMDMVAKMEVLAQEWREKMAGSVEARRARESLKLHKIKMKKLAEELSIAEEWKGELEAKRRRIEESLMPPILRFFDKLKRMAVINDYLLQEAFLSGGEEVFKMLEKGATRVTQMERPALVYFVDLLLRLRQVVEGKVEVERVDKVAKVVLQELSRPVINWSSLDPWEMEVVRRMPEEIEGVPNFIARLINQLLVRVVKKKRVDVGVQTD